MPRATSTAVQPERVRERRQRGRRELGADREVAAREAAGRDVAEHHVRVGHRRLGAAVAVAGGPRHGARAARPDVQRAARVEPGDRAAARADLGDVDRRDADQLAGAAQQPAAGRERRRRPRTRGCAKRGPPRSSDAFAVVPPMSNAMALSMPSAPRERERRDDAGGRPRLEREDRARRAAASAVITPPEDCMIVSGASMPRASSRRGCRRCSAPSAAARRRSRPWSRCARTPAARAGSRSRARPAGPAAPRAGSRRRAARAPGCRCACSRQTATDSTPSSRSRAATARTSSSSSGRSTSPVGAHALVQLEAQAALDERRRLRPEEVVEVRHAHAPQLEHVAEALRRHERRARAAALEHRVRRHRRAVHDLLELAAPVAEQLGDAVDDGHVVRGRRREHLAVGELARRELEQHVGERAADVRTPHRIRPRSPGRARSAPSR